MGMRIVVISVPGQITPDTQNHLIKQAEEFGIGFGFVFEDSEGGLVTAVQKACGADGVILNAGDFARYSIAIRDAISSIEKTPVVEVTLSNSAAERDPRHSSVLSAVCAGVISGFGQDCYSLALRALVYEKSRNN